MSHVRKVRVRRLPVKAGGLSWRIGLANWVGELDWQVELATWSRADPSFSSPTTESQGIVLSWHFIVKRADQQFF